MFLRKILLLILYSRRVAEKRRELLMASEADSAFLCDFARYNKITLIAARWNALSRASAD